MKKLKVSLSTITPVASFHKEFNTSSFESEIDFMNTRKGDVIMINADNEKSFYKIYLKLLGIEIDIDNELRNRSGVQEIASKTVPLHSLPEGDLEYISYLMAKPLTYTFSYSQKSDTFTTWGKDLGKTAISAKNAFGRLRKAQYIYKTEDKIWVLCEELEFIRRKIKHEIAQHGFCYFTYVFSSVITNEQ